jgi:hypothetical protein
MPYQWDSVPAYRLQYAVVNKFLMELYFNDHIQFWIPRALTDVGNPISSHRALNSTGLTDFLAQLEKEKLMDRRT